MSKIVLRYALDNPKDGVHTVVVFFFREHGVQHFFRCALDNAKNSVHTVVFLRKNNVRNLLPLRLRLTGLLT